MTILVTGANGQLGNEMRIVSRNSSDRYLFSDINDQAGVETFRLDITDMDAVEKVVEANNIDAIVNCAAYTNVDAAEDNEALAYKLNAEAPAILAKVMARRQGLIVHISTDYVFGKEVYNTPCREDMTGTPTGVYGASKLQGEKNIIAAGFPHLIIRTAWLYSEYGKNFLKTMLNLTQTKPLLKVVYDQVGTPTYALDLANAIYSIINERKYIGKTGIYNYSNEGVCSWFDFTKHIASYAGHNNCYIIPCRSEEYPSKVVRPAYSVLDKTKIRATFGVEIPYWTDSLQVCMRNICR